MSLRIKSGKYPAHMSIISRRIAVIDAKERLNLWLSTLSGWRLPRQYLWIIFTWSKNALKEDHRINVKDHDYDIHGGRLLTDVPENESANV